MAGRVILVRHGQTTNNVKRVIDTHLPGAELSELGRTQAARVGKELAGLTGEMHKTAWSATEGQKAGGVGIVGSVLYGICEGVAD